MSKIRIWDLYIYICVCVCVCKMGLVVLWRQLNFSTFLSSLFFYSSGNLFCHFPCVLRTTQSDSRYTRPHPWGIREGGRHSIPLHQRSISVEVKCLPFLPHCTDNQSNLFVWAKITMAIGF